MKISKMSSSKAFSLPIVYKIRFFRVLVVHVMHYCINYMLSRGIVCERGYTIYCTGMISSHHKHKLVIYAIKKMIKIKVPSHVCFMNFTSQFNGLLTSPCRHTVKMKSKDKNIYHSIKAIACRTVLYNTS